jgi:hypothetical protein
MPWSEAVPVLLDCRPEELCSRRYHGHARGCPNYGKRVTCPPQAALWTQRFIDQRRWFVIWNAFPFGEHIQKMRARHPDWSERQLANCLYWQGTARKQLRATIVEFARVLIDDGIPPKTNILHTSIPEAHGVNVTETMKSIGHDLEWPPKTVAYQVALAAIVKTAAAFPSADSGSKGSNGNG